jgi:7,8-dihydropterin-6-yl-methyl-4-(beta-D-ribofuranosyl)aminobenzene 5'-phosphate synthase
MIQRLKITVLIDDKGDRSDLKSEHGLALWIEADDRRILFDTGQSDALLQNARVLGIDLAEADAIVLSHGHYDHTGGLAAVLETNKTATVYCHPGAVVPRYSRRPKHTVKSIGMLPASLETLYGSGRTHWVSQPEPIGGSVGLTARIPRATAYEDIGGAFFLDSEGKYPDPIEDDLAMWLRTDSGVVVVTGCCHSGIVNTVNYIRTLVAGKVVYCLLGGLHLMDASPDRIARTCDVLAASGIRHMMPCHCTGPEATCAMQASGSFACDCGSTGTVLNLLTPV